MKDPKRLLVIELYNIASNNIVTEHIINIGKEKVDEYVNNLKAKEKPLDYADVTAFLDKCNENLIRFIELSLAYAREFREFQSEFKLADNDVAVLLNREVNEIAKLRKGGTNLRLSDITELRSARAQEFEKTFRKIKVGSELK